MLADLGIHRWDYFVSSVDLRNLSFGMRVMSEGIQKVAGDGMRRIMASRTQGRFFGLMTGVVGYLPGAVLLRHHQ